MRGVRGYTLEGVVGRGSMGTVWRARQVASDGRVVALKRVPAGDPLLAERLRREGRALARLDHPHVVRVLEIVPDGDGVAIAMQYAPGGSLADRLARQGRLAPGDAVAVLAPIADALGSAHRHGIVHRDVKPANILFTSDGEPLLSDFGIARSSAERPLTAPDVRGLGTAEYLDPAVADGAPPDARSDVYALGTVAYEVLAGRRPFTGGPPLAVLRAADRGQAPPLGPDVPPALARAVATAMARDPRDRYPDAGSFATPCAPPPRPPAPRAPRPSPAPAASAPPAPRPPRRGRRRRRWRGRRRRPGALGTDGAGGDGGGGGEPPTTEFGPRPPRPGPVAAPPARGGRCGAGSRSAPSPLRCWWCRCSRSSRSTGAGPPPPRPPRPRRSPPPASARRWTRPRPRPARRC